MTLDQNSAWIKKYQPSTIDGYVFNNDQHRQLVTSWLESEKIDGNILLYGAPGLGKTTLAEILIRQIVKTQADLFRVKSRSVVEIDELKSWVGKAPSRSNHNIIYIEEIDKLSKQAQVTLKDGLMEKYVNTCIFICCSNHPRKLDPALLSRFTYKFNLSAFEKENLYNRISVILKEENAEYNEDQLKVFVEENYQKGLRDILNLLQISYITNGKKIVFSDLAGKTEAEENTISLFLSIVKTVLSITDSRQKKTCMIYPVNSVISQDYVNFVTLLNNNWDLDYDQIFEELVDCIDLYPAKNIIARYHEYLDDKKYPHLHMIACLYEVIEACCKAQL
jgi:replication-associated recombination protein RarA